jgi:hypothetical protein
VLLIRSDSTQAQLHYVIHFPHSPKIRWKQESVAVETYFISWKFLVLFCVILRLFVSLLRPQAKCSYGSLKYAAPSIPLKMYNLLAFLLSRLEKTYVSDKVLLNRRETQSWHPVARPWKAPNLTLLTSQDSGSTSERSKNFLFVNTSRQSASPNKWVPAAAQRWTIASTYCYIRSYDCAASLDVILSVNGAVLGHRGQLYLLLSCVVTVPTCLLLSFQNSNESERCRSNHFPWDEEHEPVTECSCRSNAAADGVYEAAVGSASTSVHKCLYSVPRYKNELITTDGLPFQPKSFLQRTHCLIGQSPTSSNNR